MCMALCGVMGKMKYNKIIRYTNTHTHRIQKQISNNTETGANKTFYYYYLLSSPF